MDPFATVAGTVASIRHAIEITRLIRESFASLEEAEQKLKFAELTQTLADTMTQLAEIQLDLTEKDQKIKDLEEAFQSKDSLVRFLDAFYEAGPDGKPTGEPYCMHCWQVNHKKYFLHHAHGGYGFLCSNCKNTYTSVWTAVELKRL